MTRLFIRAPEQNGLLQQALTNGCCAKGTRSFVFQNEQVLAPLMKAGLDPDCRATITRRKARGKRLTSPALNDKPNRAPMAYLAHFKAVRDADLYD